MEIDLTHRAEGDLERLPETVRDTLFSKLDATEKNLGIGASPRQAFDKYLSGNMHPALQMNLGRDYRAWFLEGKYLEKYGDDKVYCIRVLTKKEAQKLAGKISDFTAFAENLP